VAGRLKEIRRGGRMKRYFRLIGIFAGSSIAAQLEYRANFIVNLVGSLFTAVGSLFGLSVLLAGGSSLGGWNQLEAIVVVGVFTLIEGYMGMFLYSNLNKISEGVRTGSMDFTLLKPLDSQFLVSSRNVNILRIADLFIGTGLIIYASTRLASVQAPGILIAVLLILAGFASVYSIWFMLCTTAFWWVGVENITELFWGFFRAGQFPVTAFPGWGRILFTFVIPVAFITTVPAEALIGRGKLETAIGALGVALLLLVVSRLFWKFALRNYTSASS
jgi:ABC-2 type transport system permease protein